MKIKRFFKWKYKPSGWCPVQAEGWFMGTWFYFRSRGTTATIEFAVSERAWEKDKTIKAYELYETEWPNAGWISNRFAKWLIFKGCLYFFLRIKSDY